MKPQAAKLQRMAWFDVPVKDLARAKAFYEGVVGWSVKEEYPGVGVFDHDASTTGGCLFVDKETEPSEHGALLYYDVTGRHVEAEVLVAKLGGKVLTPKHPIGPFGYRSIVLDSEGNRIALHSEPEVA
jgi:hypothetical protein